MDYYITPSCSLIHLDYAYFRKRNLIDVLYMLSSCNRSCHLFYVSPYSAIDALMALAENNTIVIWSSRSSQQFNQQNFQPCIWSFFINFILVYFSVRAEVVKSKANKKSHFYRLWFVDYFSSYTEVVNENSQQKNC